jgi:hypothetical protein
VKVRHLMRRLREADPDVVVLYLARYAKANHGQHDFPLSRRDAGDDLRFLRPHCRHSDCIRSAECTSIQSLWSDADT